MECDYAREALWPPGRPREHTEDGEAAEAHVEACADCTAFFARDARLGRRLSGLDLTAAAPEGLRASISDALSSEEITAVPARSSEGSEVPASPRGSRLKGWRIPLAAAAVLTAFLAGLEISRSESREDRASLFAEDFLRIAAVSPTNTDPTSIENFYQAQIGHRIRPVQLADATVRKALVCDIRGARGATIEYDMDGERLAHYRIPVAQLSVSRTGAVEMSDVGDGVHVARWVDDQYEHALVGTVSTKKMEDLIRDEFGAGSEL